MFYDISKIDMNVFFALTVRFLLGKSIRLFSTGFTVIQFFKYPPLLLSIIAMLELFQDDVNVLS